MMCKLWVVEKRHKVFVAPEQWDFLNDYKDRILAGDVYYAGDGWAVVKGEKPDVPPEFVVYPLCECNSDEGVER